MENMNNYHNETPEISNTSGTLESLQSEVNTTSQLKELSKIKETINKLTETYGTQVDIVAPGIIRISGKTVEDNTFLENYNGRWTLKWYQKTFASLEEALKIGTFISRISEVTWNDAQKIYLDDNGSLYIDKKWALDPNVSKKIVSDRIPIDSKNLEEIQDILAATRMQEEYIEFDTIWKNIRNLIDQLHIDETLVKNIQTTISMVDLELENSIDKIQVMQKIYQLAEWSKGETNYDEGIEIRIPEAHHHQVEEILKNTTGTESTKKLQDIFGKTADFKDMFSFSLIQYKKENKNLQGQDFDVLLKEVSKQQKDFITYYNTLKEEYHIQIVKRFQKKDTNVSVSPNINTDGITSLWTKTQHKITTYVRVEISLPNGTKETKDIAVNTKITSTGISFGGNTVIPTLKDPDQIKKFLDKPVGYTILKERWQKKHQTWINLKNTLIAETQ